MIMLISEIRLQSNNYGQFVNSSENNVKCGKNPVAAPLM